MNVNTIQRKLLLLSFVIAFILITGTSYFLSLLKKSDQELEKIKPSTDWTAANTSQPNVQRSTSDQLIANQKDSRIDSIAQSISLIRNQNQFLYSGIIVFSSIVIAVFTSGAFLILRGFKKSLKKPALILDNLVKGNTTVIFTPTEDEFSGIINAANQLSQNLNRASTFAKSIGDGNFAFDFIPASERDTLGNSLIQMREKLKTIADVDKKTNWKTSGLAMFADLVRRQEDQKSLADKLISELVKHTQSNQGGMFILNRDNENDLYLELVSCYAYERKKYLTKRIGIGDGMVGQCFREGQTVLLTKVPQEYVAITSGLGSGNPTSLVIVPLKLNETIEGVIELASFKKYAQHEIEFIEKVGEIIASAINNSRIAERTKKMLSETQEQSEELRAQEEEMRQNMEEMQATQETMERQAAEMKKIQTILELEKSMFNVLMEVLPDRITYKDTESRILRINKAKAQRLNMKAEHVIGKTDYDFFSAEHAEKAMREEKALIQSGIPILDIEERLVFNNGDIAWVSTSRIPFKNEHNKTIGMFIITKDVTQLKKTQLQLRDREMVIQRILKDLPIFHYKVNQDMTVYEAWIGNHKNELPDSSHLLSKPLKDIFPNVYECIASNTAEGQICLESFGTSPFRHYVFKDSAYEGCHWVYAVLDNSCK